MMESTPTSSQSIPPDVVLSAVANEHRRVILRSLDHTDGKVMEFEALVDQVANHLRKANEEPLDDDHRQRVRTALHHIHLPKLEACGMIVHDTETKQVRNVTGELVQDLLSTVESYETQ